MKRNADAVASARLLGILKDLAKPKEVTIGLSGFIALSRCLEGGKPYLRACVGLPELVGKLEEHVPRMVFSPAAALPNGDIPSATIELVAPGADPSLKGLLVPNLPTSCPTNKIEARDWRWLLPLEKFLAGKARFKTAPRAGDGNVLAVIKFYGGTVWTGRVVEMKSGGKNCIALYETPSGKEARAVAEYMIWSAAGPVKVSVDNRNAGEFHAGTLGWFVNDPLPSDTKSDFEPESIDFAAYATLLSDKAGFIPSPAAGPVSFGQRARALDNHPSLKKLETGAGSVCPPGGTGGDNQGGGG